MSNLKAVLTPQQENSITNYRRMGIDISVQEDNRVIISQKRLINSCVLNQSELKARARAIFPQKKYKIIPEVYAPDFDSITDDWILAQMETYGIKRNDLVHQMGLEKSYISLLFAPAENPRKINLSKPMKAAFYYYFKSYETAREIIDLLHSR